jgi:DNA-binding HxlR family transcriptional regulator
MRKAPTYQAPTAACSIERAVTVLGERWTFLIVRQAHAGTTRFIDFQRELGVAPDVLTARLQTLVQAGILERQSYQEPGERVRYSYHLTAAGVELRLVLGALQQWGDVYLPRPEGPSAARRHLQSGRPVHVSFVDDEGRPVEIDSVTISAPVQ